MSLVMFFLANDNCEAVLCKQINDKLFIMFVFVDLSWSQHFLITSSIACLDGNVLWPSPLSVMIHARLVKWSTQRFYKFPKVCDSLGQFPVFLVFQKNATLASNLVFNLASLITCFA